MTYLKAFLVFLGRHKLYTAINVFGFSMSLMFVILLTSYTVQEFSVDQFHEKKERVFRLTNESYPRFAFPIADDLRARYPEIERTTRAHYLENLVKSQDRKFNASFILSDSSFFETFSFTLLEGDVRQVMRAKGCVMLSEAFAHKVFGTEEVVGRTIEVAGYPATVEGVYRDFGNSHLQTPDLMADCADWLAIVAGTVGSDFNPLAYNMANTMLFLTLKPGADLHPKLPDMATYFKDYYWPFKMGHVKEVHLEPLTEIYFSPFSDFGGTRSGDRRMITLLGSVALLILLFAVINYVNLSMAQSTFRAREMATRRLLGSSRGVLMMRLMLESVLLCLCSFAVAMLLAFAAEPIFDQLLQTKLDLAASLTVEQILSYLFVVAAVGMAAGVIPAWTITNFQPIDVVRGTFTRKTKMTYNKLLISFQYFITIVMIGCSIIMGRQLNHMISADVGFNTNQILILESAFPCNMEAFKNELLCVSGVEAVCLTRGNPFGDVDNNSSSHNDQPISFELIRADSSFFDIMQPVIVKDNHNEAVDAVWLNETAVCRMELPDTALSFILAPKEIIPIAGVIRDFQTQDFSQTARPMQLTRLRPGYAPWQILVQVSGSDLGRTVTAIEQSYANFSGGVPLQINFSEQEIQKRYEKQTQTLQMITYFAMIAILISALGILAMSTFFIRQRSGEIAVRKVFGATRGEVLRMLMSQFLRLVLVGFVLAVPLIWFLMRDWLMDYSLRISLHWTLFALAGLIAFAIALGTIFFQSRHAANQNPSNALKQ